MNYQRWSAAALVLCACGSGERNGATSLSGSGPSGSGGARTSVPDAGPSEPHPDATSPDVNPEYDGQGALVRPTGWQSWVFLGSALNLSYASANPPLTDVLSAVYMEPTAFRHFKDTGEFREGTMTVLTTYTAGAAGPPALGGVVPMGPDGFEMSVKDHQKRPEGWAYYHFDGGPTVASSANAPASPKSACFDCHQAHGETDNVFTQYYPMLP